MRLAALRPWPGSLLRRWLTVRAACACLSADASPTTSAAVCAAVAQVPCGQSRAGHTLDAKHAVASRLWGPWPVTYVLPPPTSPRQVATQPRLIEALVARFVRRVQAR